MCRGSQTSFLQQFLEIFLVGVEFAEKLFDCLWVGASGALSAFNLLLSCAARRLTDWNRRLLLSLLLLHITTHTHTQIAAVRYYHDVT